MGGGGTLLVEGIRSVLINCSLPDGISCISQLNAVLYIPSLGHSLVSWNILKSKGYVMTGAGETIVVALDNKPVFMTKFIGGLPFVVQTDTELTLISTMPNNQPPHQLPHQPTHQPPHQPMHQPPHQPTHQPLYQPSDIQPSQSKQTSDKTLKRLVE